ncbi:MAG: Hpt domain-containing protein [Methylobacter sp.]|nr:Hpt domain-containing protein [Methylobacter sp.]
MKFLSKTPKTEAPKKDNTDKILGPKDNNPMKKIILMVGVAILVFLAFIFYSLHTSVRNSEQLSAIKDLYFPVLERVDANIVRIDHIEERMMQAVMTGEKDELDNAAEFYKQAGDVFAEMTKLYPARQNDINLLIEEFKQYFELAQKTSLSLLENGGEDKSGMSAQMNKSLADLRKNILQFRKASYDNFVNTLVESQRAATVNLYMGIAVGVMNLLFMVVLVYFIRNNVKMMSVIAEQNATLEHRVAERTAELSQKTNDINAMLHNMNLGVCTVVQGNRIHHEYSEYLSVIFDSRDIAGRDVMSCLFDAAQLGLDTKDQINVALESILGEDAMMFDFNGHLLVREMQIEDSAGRRKTLQLSWTPIINDQDIVEKMLLIVQDVTELRTLELASAHQKEELDIISQIIKISIGKFNDFIASAHDFVAESRVLLEQTEVADADVMATLFRNMHTIKGNARTYEFSFITDAAHEAEQEYDRLRKDGDAVWDFEKLLAGLDAVEAAINRYVEVNEDKLGRKGRASDLLTTRGSFISNDEITELKATVAKLAARVNDADSLKLQKAINRLGLIPLERLVTGTLDSVASLAKELNKPAPDFKIINGDIAFDHDFAEALKSSFMHIVRNSLDHGIETPEDRRRADKAERGLLSFICADNNGRMELHICDDGRGLALHKLYEKGLAAGLFSSDDTPAPEAVAELIFNSGLSTADQVTQVSGRGVGMDAVRSFLNKHNADIGIVLNNPDNVLGFAPFKFIIKLPAESHSL